MEIQRLIVDATGTNELGLYDVVGRIPLTRRTDYNFHSMAWRVNEGTKWTDKMNSKRNKPLQQIDLWKVQFTPELLRCIPPVTFRKYHVIPVWDTQDHLCIALADPTKYDVIDMLYLILGRDLQVLQADQRAMDAFIEKLYGDNGG